MLLIKHAITRYERDAWQTHIKLTCITYDSYFWICRFSPHRLSQVALSSAKHGIPAMSRCSWSQVVPWLVQVLIIIKNNDMSLMHVMACDEAHEVHGSLHILVSSGWIEILLSNSKRRSSTSKIVCTSIQADASLVTKLPSSICHHILATKIHWDIDTSKIRHISTGHKATLWCHASPGSYEHVSATGIEFLYAMCTTYFCQICCMYMFHI